jgi:anti-sigma factor RsiW
MTCCEAEPLLDAHLDNEFDAAGSAAIDRHLSECRACAAHYAALQNLHEEIAAAALAYTPPPALERKLAARFLGQKASATPFWSRPWRSLYVLVGAALCGIILILSLPILRNTPEPSVIAAEILDSHLRSLQPGHLVDVPSSDQHTVKPWFQGKTSFSPPVPDLTNNGFVLIGGRLEVVHQQPVAAIVYQRRQHVISLDVSPWSGAPAKQEVRELGGYHLVHWAENNMSYWAVSDVNAADLRTFADLIAAN